MRPTDVARLGGALMALAVWACAASADPFRRYTDPVLVPTGPSPSSVPVPPAIASMQNGYSAFYVVNPNNYFVRLQGFEDANAANETVTSTTGWLFPPGFAGVFSTQYPHYLSAVAFDTPAYPIANVTKFLPLELDYGFGQ